MTRVVAIDTETAWADDYSVEDLGYHGYVTHPRFKCLCVCAADENGDERRGTPETFDWGFLKGAAWVCHNAPFDLHVLAKLRAVGTIPQDVIPDGVGDTADLAAYHGWPRSLAQAAKNVLGRDLDKSTRDTWKGADTPPLPGMPDGSFERMVEYCMEDARATRDLWLQLAGGWPEKERRLSRQTWTMCRRGIRVDVQRAEEYKGRLASIVWEIETAMPWFGKGKPTSRVEFARYCRSRGIAPPPSLAEDSPELEAWESEHGEDPVVGRMSEWRKRNRELQLIRTVLSKLHGDIFRFSLKYFGASITGRWSGDGGANMQNFPRSATDGIDIRSIFIPREGKRFAVVDLSQIEPRCVAWLTDNREQLDAFAAGQDIYDINARQALNYTDPRPLKDVDKELRNLSKVQVLSLGFGTGPAKYAATVKAWTGQEISEEVAKGQVNRWRKENRAVTRAWDAIDLELHRAAREGRDYELTLPSGRVMRYRSPKASNGNISAHVAVGRQMAWKKFFASRGFENQVQGMARDVFAESLLHLEDANLTPTLHVHDEVVVEVDSTADLDRVVQLMEKTPEWATGLPVGAEGKIMERYGK